MRMLWNGVLVMEQKWILLDYSEMKESTGCGPLFGVGESAEKNRSDDSEGFGSAIVEQCCHLLRRGRKECGRNHYSCFRRVDLVMTLNRYLSRAVIVDSWDSEKRSYLKKCLSH